MEIAGWYYYNHAMIPSVAPHEVANLEPIKNGGFWKMKDCKPLLARWTSEYDCGYDTNWWYVIKDSRFDISELKAKRRYEITKGIKNFDVKKIDPVKYADEICSVYKEAFNGYPLRYRPAFDESKFKRNIYDEWKTKCIYGGFDRKDGKLCGYALLTIHENYVSFNVLKTNPSCEKRGINAAMVNGILDEFNDKLCREFYLCDGERNIAHETDFQNYLEKYFGFRKAYCTLNVTYRPIVAIAVKILYPFRKIFKNFECNGLMHNIVSVLYMEELNRNAWKGRK